MKPSKKERATNALIETCGISRKQAETIISPVKWEVIKVETRWWSNPTDPIHRGWIFHYEFSDGTCGDDMGRYTQRDRPDQTVRGLRRSASNFAKFMGWTLHKDWQLTIIN